MADHLRLGLTFSDEVDPVVVGRIDYAFRLFCACFGFVPAAGGGIPRLCYGADPHGPLDVSIPAGYRKERNASTPEPTFVFGPRGLSVLLERGFPAFHPADGEIDWLGEIFAWCSGSLETSVTARDEVGRIPFAATVHGRHGLDPAVPYAAVAMWALNHAIRSRVGERWPERPVTPPGVDGGFAVAATHDIDFLPVSAGAVLHRAVKNAAIALAAGDAGRLASMIGAAARRLGGATWLDRSLERLSDREAAEGIRSTYTVLCRRSHRRDGNYDITDPEVLRTLARLAERGAEIAVHGSYTSLEASGRLADEYGRLREVGFDPVGGRQHWLRTDGHALFDALTETGARYDSTVGYPERPGFRHGVCFPYPPYDFARERAHPFLEIPLVVMDASLYAVDSDPTSWSVLARGVLDRARLHGWGGVAVLWHDTTMSGAQYPRALGDVYWALREPSDVWVPAAEIVEAVSVRYIDAGLLPDRTEAT